MRQLTNIPELGESKQGSAGEILNPAEFYASDGWYKEAGGISFQGGRSSSYTVSFENPFASQCLGVFLQGLTVDMTDLYVDYSSITKEGFTVVGPAATIDFFWQAIGA